MAKIQVVADVESSLEVVEAAIAAEKKRLKIGLDNTQKRIERFEKKYQTSSSEFLDKMAAEDLDGDDEEYVAWVGELKIRQRILGDIEKLQSVEYVAR